MNRHDDPERYEAVYCEQPPEYQVASRGPTVKPRSGLERYAIEPRRRASSRSSSPEGAAERRGSAGAVQPSDPGRPVP